MLVVAATNQAYKLLCASRKIDLPQPVIIVIVCVGWVFALDKDSGAALMVAFMYF